MGEWSCDMDGRRTEAPPKFQSGLFLCQPHDCGALGVGGSVCVCGGGGGGVRG